MAEVVVTRWVNETTGRKTRKWYWETRYGGRTVAAGIQAKQDAAHQRAVEELALAAYTAGLCEADMCPHCADPAAPPSDLQSALGVGGDGVVTPEQIVDDVAASAALDGHTTGPEERVTLLEIATGELDAEVVVRALVEQARRRDG